MATRQVLGRVLIVMKGEYNNIEEYEKLDVVTYEGSSYIAKKDTVGNLPTNTEFWDLLAKKGEDNAISDEDLEKVKNEVTEAIKPDVQEGIKEDLDKLINISPLVASSVDEMTDTTRVYVNTTDGNWYYYNGANWEIGGVYQATQISHDNINISNLDNSILNNYYEVTELTNFNIGGYSQTTKEFDSNIKNRCYVTFEIKDKILINYLYFKTNNNIIFTSAIYDNNYQKIIVTDFTNINDGYFFNSNLVNQKTISLIFKKNDESNFTQEEINSFKVKLYYNNFININNFLNVKDKKLIGNFEFGGVSSIDGNLVDNIIRCRSKQINFNEKNGERTIYIKNMPENTRINFVVAYKYGKFYKSLEIVKEFYSSNNYIIIKNKDDNFNSIIISLVKNDESNFTEDEVNNIKYIKIKEFENDLEDKEWAGLGDSITYGFIPRNYTGYPGQLFSYLPLVCSKIGMTAKNYGMSGSTIAYHSTRNPMCERYTEMTDDADIITVMGGTNDIRNGIQLGTINDSTNETFYGALKILAQGLYDKYYINQGIEKGKNKHIIFFTPIKLLQSSSNIIGGTGVNYNLEPWCNAIKEVAKMYSFPVIDLQNISQLNPALSQIIKGNTESYTETYNPYMTDGTHPTQEGHEILANIIKNYIQNM